MTYTLSFVKIGPGVKFVEGNTHADTDTAKLPHKSFFSKH